MKKFKALIWFAFLLFLSLSCEKIIDDFDFKEKDPRIVVNGIIKKDSLTFLHISKSIPAQNPDTVLPLANASVTLYESGNIIEKLSYNDSGFFKSSTFNNPQPQKYYKINVEAKGFKTAEALTRFPSRPNVLSIDTTDYNPASEFDYYFDLGIKIHFKDNPQEKNFYMVELKHKVKQWVYNDYAHQPTDSMIYDETPYIISEDEIIEIEFGGEWYWKSSSNWEASGRTLIFSDKLINGKKHTLKFTPEYIDMNNSVDSTLQVMFHSISKEYFDYMMRRALANESDGNPLSEPVTLYTNVNNGLGIFGAQNTYTQSVVLESGQYK